jgi:hypothetical protein
VALVGYACAVVLLPVITSWVRIGMLSPLGVLLISPVVLATEFGKGRESSAGDRPTQPGSRDNRKTDEADLAE